MKQKIREILSRPDHVKQLLADIENVAVALKKKPELADMKELYSDKINKALERLEESGMYYRNRVRNMNFILERLLDKLQGVEHND